ncbi:MAG TPA: MSMEG_0569 family flavin-dependent oxidoreductase, partial [Polyangiaceae bacterium]|nr:MSMEG_0569 family flavin-dependent oxidoreductase [Polyangiaceae bacterium]
PHGFMKKPEILDYFASYRRAFDPPVLERTAVISVTESSARARFEVGSSAGTFFADQVVVATGGYQTPRIPTYASELPRDVLQIHAGEYRNPEQLPDGEVLVVGTGQSGCQIAEDLQLAGRRVHLAVGNAPRCARRYRGRDVVEWLHAMGYYDIPYDRHPDRDKVRDKTNHYVTGRDGGHDIDLRQFALEGMQLYGPLDSIRAGVLHFARGLKENLDSADATYGRINRSIDAFIDERGVTAPPPVDYVPVWEPENETSLLDCRSAGITSVIWCIGFGADYRWLELPVLDDLGYPLHERGVTPVPGLYFIGLPWLYTWGSGRLCGVGRDSEYLTTHIEALYAPRYSTTELISSIGVSS